MFTFRACANSFAPGPSMNDYDVYSAERYTVKHTVLLSGAVEIQVWLCDGKNTFPEGHTLSVGLDSQYSQVFVMNEKGKTIDTIRDATPVNAPVQGVQELSIDGRKAFFASGK